MRYKVDFTSQAFQNISKLDKPIAERILNKIDWLADNLDIIIPQPLRGEFQGVYKLVVGDWRVFYSETWTEILNCRSIKSSPPAGEDKGEGCI